MLVRTALGLAIIFAGIQFVGPARTNPPVKPGADLCATNPPPAEVAALLRAACYDCHSHETVWPWYAHIAPVSWLVVSDVNEGREHINFSEWPHDDPVRAAKKLDHMNEVIDDGDMPPAKYTSMHPAARLTPEQKQKLLDWTDAAAKKLRPEDSTK